jgi:dsDNA-binding SOS-regulon protein
MKEEKNLGLKSPGEKDKIDILEASLELLEQAQQESLPLFMAKSDKELSSVEKAGSEALQSPSPALLINQQSSNQTDSAQVVSSSPTVQPDIEMTEENPHSESEKDKNEDEVKNEKVENENK